MPQAIWVTIVTRSTPQQLSWKRPDLSSGCTSKLFQENRMGKNVHILNCPRRVSLLVSVSEKNPESDVTQLGALEKFDVTDISNTPKAYHIRRFDGPNDLRLGSLGAYEW
ncbi:hypothetical protein NPIL_265521 [Nephila pilipes]|uniref:Uncharacterized protein n=1 Tax=Nephila pilipes TaxID=299642 RepID=A0A8X6N5X1_NEPPI|nr:hypothetical protein NPIL_265521 [Nephila pilipes]